MERRRFSEEQIIAILKEQEAGVLASCYGIWTKKPNRFNSNPHPQIPALL